MALQYGSLAVRHEGFVASLDSVILQYKLDVEGDAVLQYILERETEDLWLFDHSTVYGGIGKFRERFTVTPIDCPSSFTVLVGQYSSSGRLDSKIVRLDFNPNKIPLSHPWLGGLLSWLSVHSKFVDLVRYDLAFDMPYPRTDFLLFRDNRLRSFEASYLNAKSMTEYLGRRNAVGRFKLYDKTEESGLDYPLTRAELTCDGRWGRDAIVKHLPHVVRLMPFLDSVVDAQKDLQEVDKVVLKLILLNPSQAYLLDTLPYRKKKTLQNILLQCSEESPSILLYLSQLLLDSFLDGLESFVFGLLPSQIVPNSPAKVKGEKCCSWCDRSSCDGCLVCADEEVCL